MYSVDKIMKGSLQWNVVVFLRDKRESSSVKSERKTNAIVIVLK